MISLHSSGVSLYSRERIIVLIATDLPDPVVPAIKRCGIFAKLATTGSPPMSFPKAIGSFWFPSPKNLEDKISRKTTFSLASLGSSIPITVFPGIVETRADSADIERAISSERPITLLAFKPGAGSSSYIVTTGPGLTDTISPRTP